MRTRRAGSSLKALLLLVALSATSVGQLFGSTHALALEQRAMERPLFASLSAADLMAVGATSLSLGARAKKERLNEEVTSVANLSGRSLPVSVTLAGITGLSASVAPGVLAPGQTATIWVSGRAPNSRGHYTGTLHLYGFNQYVHVTIPVSLDVTACGDSSAAAEVAEAPPPVVDEPVDPMAGEPSAAEADGSTPDGCGDSAAGPPSEVAAPVVTPTEPSAPPAETNVPGAPPAEVTTSAPGAPPAEVTTSAPGAPPAEAVTSVPDALPAEALTSTPGAPPKEAVTSVPDALPAEALTSTPGAPPAEALTTAPKAETSITHPSSPPAAPTGEAAPQPPAPSGETTLATPDTKAPATAPASKI